MASGSPPLLPVPSCFCSTNWAIPLAIGLRVKSAASPSCPCVSPRWSGKCKHGPVHPAKVLPARPLCHLVLASVLLLAAHSVSHALALAGEVGASLLRRPHLVAGWFQSSCPVAPLMRLDRQRPWSWQFHRHQRRAFRLAAGNRSVSFR